MALRQGMFFASASVAGAFSGLLTFAIVKMDGIGGLAGWRWMWEFPTPFASCSNIDIYSFILEGLLTVVVAVASYFLIYDYPGTASFLSEEEKSWIIHRLKYQGSKKSGRMVAESDSFEWKYVRQALTDWQLYVDLFVFWGGVGPLYGKQASNTYQRCGKHANLYILGISFFLPTIIKELGYTATTAQLLTVPIYVAAAIVALIVCWASDRAAKSGRSRWPYVFGSLCTVLVGYVMAIAGSAGNIPGVVYAGKRSISLHLRHQTLFWRS
jgi:hypothetical protein